MRPSHLGGGSAGGRSGAISDTIRVLWSYRLSTEEQEYDPTSTINVLRRHVDGWRMLPDPSLWGVTPETARLLQHWRHHEFADIQPFFCQVEAVETVIWLTEVATGQRNREVREILERLDAPEEDMPVYRNLWEHIKTDMPKKDRNKSGQLDPLEIPPELQTAGWVTHSGRFRK